MDEHRVYVIRSFPSPTTAHYDITCSCGWSDEATNKKDYVNKKRMHIRGVEYGG